MSNPMYSHYHRSTEISDEVAYRFCLFDGLITDAELAVLLGEVSVDKTDRRTERSLVSFFSTMDQHATALAAIRSFENEHIRERRLAAEKTRNAARMMILANIKAGLFWMENTFTIQGSITENGVARNVELHY